MGDAKQNLDCAISMMKDALAMLDQLGEADAALYLQLAISIASRDPVPSRREADRSLS